MTYTDYPFTADGVNFVSRIANHSPFLGAIKNIPADDFAQMNIQAVRDLIGNASLMTQAEIISELYRVNDGATHSWILLGVNA